MTIPTVCHRCGNQYEGGTRCDCGEPLWYDSAGAAVDWQDSPDRPGLWRYSALLPATEPRGIGGAAGNTPLVRSEGLDSVAGCRIFVKDETEQPTGAYKDRGSAVALSMVDRSDDRPLGTVSYGNMAMSTAAHAASVDRDCVVLVPSDTSAVRLELVAQYGPTILGVEGDYGALYDDIVSLSEASPVKFFLSDPPARTSGYKTAVYELSEQFPSGEPDAIALPASSGGFASGVYQGVLDLQAAGRLDSLPRLYLVQTAAADPIARAFESGADDVTPMDEDETGESIAHSIGNPAPPSGNVALDAARETGGAVVSVSDDEIRAAKRAFARRAGFCVEPASATPLAGVERLAAAGEIDATDDVVLLPTGTGFKEAGTGDAPEESPAESVRRAAVAERLDALFGGD